MPRKGLDEMRKAFLSRQIWMGDSLEFSPGFTGAEGEEQKGEAVWLRHWDNQKKLPDPAQALAVNAFLDGKWRLRGESSWKNSSLSEESWATTRFRRRVSGMPGSADPTEHIFFTFTGWEWGEEAEKR